MSEPSRAALADTLAGDAHPPLVARVMAGLRQRYADRIGGNDPGRGALRPFEVRLPDRTAFPIGSGEPAFALQIVNEKGLEALAAFDELALAEAYLHGDLDIEGEILAALRQRPVLGDSHRLKYLAAACVRPLVGRIRRGGKRAPSQPDPGSDFFFLWLDRERHAFSHGLFENDEEPLSTAIERKFRYAFQVCGMQPGQRVLDIGGGWGAFLRFAGERGVRVTSVTDSEESAEIMRELIRRHGLACEVVMVDFLAYQAAEPFDAIVGMGVTEHLPDYRRTLAQYERLLRPGGRVYLDAYSSAPPALPSFVAKWVFRGHRTPLRLAEYLAEVERSRLEVVTIQSDRHSYFLTCKRWAENLEASRDEVIARWGAYLYRRSALNLWSSAHSLQSGALSAYRLVLERPAVPVT